MGNLLRQLHGASRWQIQRNSECAWFVSVGRIALLGVRVYLSSITTTAISDVRASPTVKLCSSLNYPLYLQGTLQ